MKNKIKEEMPNCLCIMEIQNHRRHAQSSLLLNDILPGDQAGRRCTRP